jgi:CHASE2 domain-containing sensor protein
MLHKLVLLFGFLFVLVILWQKLFYWLVSLVKPISDYKHNRWTLFTANFFVGLIVWGALTFVQDYPLIMDAEDANLDFAMQVRQDDIPPAKAKDIPPFVFLDIDNQTHKRWGEPLFTPRNKVKELIDVAVKGEARLVIVDIDLSQKTPTGGLTEYFENISPKLQLHPYDQELYDYLSTYSTDCEGTACPPVILARVFRPLSEFDEGEDDNIRNIADLFRPNPEPIFESRTGFLEEAVSNSAPYVQWGSPLFLASSYDNVIRRWWLWQPICTNEQPEVLPSIQLLAAALIRHQTPQQAQEGLNSALSQFKPTFCSDDYIPQSLSSEPIKIAEGLEITEGMYGIRQRIMYNMPWLPPTNVAEKWTVRYFLLDYDEKTQERNAILTVYSAQSYLDAAKDANAGGALKDKIVVIGGSYTDGGDMHATPLDEMPGGLVIINAIHSLLQYGEITPLSHWESFFGTVISLFLIGLLFIFIGHSFWWVIFTGVLTIVSVPLSVFILSEGVWINFAFPLLAVHIHQISGNYLYLRKKLEASEGSEALRQKVANKIEESLKQSLNEKLHELTNNLPKMLEESERRVLDLTTLKMDGSFTPSSTTPSNEAGAKKPSILDDLKGEEASSQKTNSESEETSEAQSGQTSVMDDDLTALDLPAYQKPTDEKPVANPDTEKSIVDEKSFVDDLTVHHAPILETTKEEEENKTKNK